MFPYKLSLTVLSVLTYYLIYLLYNLLEVVMEFDLFLTLAGLIYDCTTMCKANKGNNTDDGLITE